MSVPLIESLRSILPEDVAQATLLGRVYLPAVAGPAVVMVRGDRLVDITASFPTVTDLIEQDDPVAVLRKVEGGESWSIEDVLQNSVEQVPSLVRLISPIDLSAVKAAGVTFTNSLLERLIEERAEGNPELAKDIRQNFEDLLGVRLAEVTPGSDVAAKLKAELVEQGMWSQYLEVGLGPDPEVFTKAQPLSTVGFGEEVGVAAISEWNNPEPEVVLVLSSKGRILGATLGNDVNLRDVEGRSALLLPKAKDNNASAALGPFIRLFDESYSLEDVRAARVELQILGDDGFELVEASNMAQISRDVTELAAYARSESHQYPDGLVLYTGTLFAPTKDRAEPGLGFTHAVGDVVRISSPKLGMLANRVNTAEQTKPWDFGVRALIANLHRRGLLDRVGC